MPAEFLGHSLRDMVVGEDQVQQPETATMQASLRALHAVTVSNQLPSNCPTPLTRQLCMEPESSLPSCCLLLHEMMSTHSVPKASTPRPDIAGARVPLPSPIILLFILEKLHSSVAFITPQFTWTAVCGVAHCIMNGHIRSFLPCW